MMLFSGDCNLDFCELIECLVCKESTVKLATQEGFVTVYDKRSDAEIVST